MRKTLNKREKETILIYQIMRERLVFSHQTQKILNKKKETKRNKGEKSLLTFP